MVFDIKNYKIEEKNKTKNEKLNTLKRGQDNNISLINSLKENYLSYLCIIFAIFILSLENFFLGLITFFIILYLSYIEHKNAHKIKNIYTIIHFYHHENNNFFSHFIQILLEFTVVGIFMPLYYIFGTIFLNPWILFFFILFYSSVHNINYSILHINNVHKLHHQFINTNIGPDILDIIFETKNSREKKVENTNHYIPNIIISTFIVLLIKYFWEKDIYKKNMLLFLNIYLILSFTILIITSIFLWKANINSK
jgi:hypothetical protein